VRILSILIEDYYNKKNKEAPLDKQLDDVASSIKFEFEFKK
jgi:hypothetical protein